ncbi:MAG: NAD(P)/FAD-dependent oxidoreductase [Synergistaceae bacterium]|jgi:NADPH-dependent 2,4-dienoyl-CoA reductase/sulfur reductase-like enzyme|nr:NAD(P)/FAD-dependent oxidoreductase [Synergistaceae bacterium]
METCEIAVIGGGPAGLAAAAAAKKHGVDGVLIIDRDNRLGGILNQCIHNGFGLHTFNEELTGPEYAARFVDEVDRLGIRCMLNTMVLDINERKEITVMNSSDGLTEIKAESVILAMGCRERPRGALSIPGYRPAGIYSAGTAQRLINIEGYMPGKEIVILGSGDIGLIMARRLTLEGAVVKAVAEIMPYSSGLKRNIVQCLDDFGIPLKLSHTVVDIKGRTRVEGVSIAQVDGNRAPIEGTEEYYACDTLLLSVGLIPENELSQKINLAMDPVTNSPIVNDIFETSAPGVFACGNALHVHDLVDYVSEEAAIAGKNAARHVRGPRTAPGRQISVKAADGVTYTVPRTIDPQRAEGTVKIRFRVRDVYRGHCLNVYFDGDKVQSSKKMILTPGEMEEVTLKKSDLAKRDDLKEITVKVEKE